MKKGKVLAATICLLAAIAANALRAQGIDPAGMFPEIDGWQKKGECESYSPENLYQYIDGAAENFLGYGCQRLLVQNYANDRGQALSAEIYFHGSLENAFGMYSSEKPAAGDYFSLGSEGYAEAGILNFFCSAYYVKLSAFGLGTDSEPALRKLGRAIAVAIDPSAAMPGMLRVFPSAGKIAHSERFILNNFLGHDFLRAAYAADYLVHGQKFQLFVIDAGNEASARAVLEKYAALEKEKPGTDAAVQPHKGTDVTVQPGALTINDPYNGSMRILWQGRFICGSNGRAPAADETIVALARNLPRQ
ncbi:MAG: hypothetical protein NTW95_06115 [Candidatus Aminicenantes bacterium]|nr:hypothetical protein [Candidatus Aminicenantes bacterium]